MQIQAFQGFSTIAYIAFDALIGLYHHIRQPCAVPQFSKKGGTYCTQSVPFSVICLELF
jgi:hypothetical protein